MKAILLTFLSGIFLFSIASARESGDYTLKMIVQVDGASKQQVIDMNVVVGKTKIMMIALAQRTGEPMLIEGDIYPGGRVILWTKTKNDSKSGRLESTQLIGEPDGRGWKGKGTVVHNLESIVVDWTLMPR